VKIHFFEPPPAQRIGGLDAAIGNLRAALVRAGVEVDGTLPGDDSLDHVIHFHGLWQPAHARLARQCHARGWPFVISPHGMLEPWAVRHKWWKKWPYFHLVEKHHLASTGALLATAPSEARRLQRLIPRQRIETLPLGLTGDARPNYTAAREALGWPAGERVLLFLSRLHVKKGLEMLLHALATIETPPETRLVIVGGGEDRYVRSLHAVATNLASSLPRVDWIGEVWGEERWKFFQGADLFCLPSYSENFGLAVLEACQVGTPALTTTTTPWSDLLGEARGFICEPRIASIGEQLSRFFSTPRAPREALSDWAWQTFHWDALAPRYLALYLSLLQAA
jgi:glycosyltransferase involved in cell wall biosynthesis